MTRTTLNEVIELAGLNYSCQELKEMISAAAVNSTEVFEITVQGKDPKETELIANTITKVLPDRISSIVDGSSVRIVDYAVVPTISYAPTKCGSFHGSSQYPWSVQLPDRYEQSRRSDQAVHD